MTITPRTWEVARVALKLGLTSFGGPIAHLAYFRDEYVVRRRWLSEATYAELVALSQLLPGPASSQLGIAIGTLRAGITGGVAAWLGFTLPSAVALMLFAGIVGNTDVSGAPWVHGLKLAAVAIVAHAVAMMWRSLAGDAPRSVIAIGAALVAVVASTPLVQVALIAAGALVGQLFLRAPAPTRSDPLRSPLPRPAAALFCGAFVALLFLLPVAATITRAPAIEAVEAFYRSGALVFGGGHVVLPLLHAAVVPSGWVTDHAFVAGYGAAQAVPGPLFAFAAYLGAVASVPPGGALGGIVALAAIFLPSFLLVWGALPFWYDVRRSSRARHALLGTNAAAVGILLAAFYDPVWTSAVASVADAAISLAALSLLLARLPAWSAVVACVVAAEAVRRVS